jgi:hypothetical protein
VKDTDGREGKGTRRGEGVPIRSPRRRILHRGSQMDGDAKSGGAPTIIMQRCGGWRKITNHGPCRIRFGFSQEEMRKRRRQMFREYNRVLFHIQLSKVQPQQERAFTASKTNCNQKTLHSYVPPVPLPPSLPYSRVLPSLPSANANISTSKSRLPPPLFSFFWTPPGRRSV